MIHSDSKEASNTVVYQHSRSESSSQSSPYSCLCFSGSWKEKKFKPYNFEALGVAPDCGHLHPLMKVRTQFRQIFLEMG